MKNYKKMLQQRKKEIRIDIENRNFGSAKYLNTHFERFEQFNNESYIFTLAYINSGSKYTHSYIMRVDSIYTNEIIFKTSNYIDSDNFTYTIDDVKVHAINRMNKIIENIKNS